MSKDYTLLAKDAYNIYESTLRGSPTVSFDQLPEDERAAWATVAESLYRSGKKEIKKL